MEFEELKDLIFRELTSKIECHRGLYVFAGNRSKFEGWLKVELCDILEREGLGPVPGKDSEANGQHIDLVFDRISNNYNWAMELKTVNTNYRNSNVMDRTRPITDNIKSILKDIEKLKGLESYKNKAVLFIVFPLEENNEKWQKQLYRIKSKLVENPFHKKINFNNDGSKIPGFIYLGSI